MTAVKSGLDGGNAILPAWIESQKTDCGFKEGSVKLRKMLSISEPYIELTCIQKMSWVVSAVQLCNNLRHDNHKRQEC